MAVLDIYEHRLRRSAEIARFQLEVQLEKRLLSPLDVIRVLNHERISFVLVGAYGLSGWRSQARATEDIDVVVAARQVAKAVRALSIAFPHLEPEDAAVAVRLRDKESNEVAIDVMNPLQPPNHVIFKYTKKVTAGKESYRVPTLEIQGGIGTVIWPNGANFAPEALYEIDERPSAQPESVARRRKMGA